jgi:hypothetical protein
VARARKEGDRAAANALKGLRRPTVSAWLANLVVREQPGDLRQLLELGQGLRRAQEELAGEQLRQLARRRHQVIASLCEAATAAAGASGERVTEAALTELQGTLEAAVADPDAAAALRSGRLTVALRYSGLGPTTDVQATSPRRPTTPPVPATPGPPAVRRSKAEPDPGVERAKAEAAVASRRVRERATAARDADRALERIRRERATADERRERLRRKEREASARAKQAHKDLETSRRAEERAQAALARISHT